jgi:hypothetical protein
LDSYVRNKNFNEVVKKKEDHKNNLINFRNNYEVLIRTEKQILSGEEAYVTKNPHFQGQKSRRSQPRRKLRASPQPRKPANPQILQSNQNPEKGPAFRTKINKLKNTKISPIIFSLKNSKQAKKIQMQKSAPTLSLANEEDVLT